MNIPDVVRAEADVNLLDASYSERAYAVIAEWVRRETLREAAGIAHMVHYAAECSTDGMLGMGMQSRSTAALEIRNAIRARAKEADQ